MAIVRRNPVALADFAEVVPQQCHIAFVFTKLNLVAWRDIRALVQRRATVFAYNPDKTAVYAGFVSPLRTGARSPKSLFGYSVCVGCS